MQSLPDSGIPIPDFRPPDGPDGPSSRRAKGDILSFGFQEKSEDSASVRERVMQARQIQVARFKSTNVFCNARMRSGDIRQHCRLDTDGQRLLARASDTLILSARAVHAILKVARTIADLASSADIRVGHLAEAVQFRGVDRKIGSTGNG